MFNPFCAVTTSPIASPRSLLRLRVFSIFAHVCVIVLGLYTRYPVFFVQFTNWTNLLSFAYAVLAFAHSWIYVQCSVAKTRIPRLKKAGPTLLKMARLQARLLGISLPMHCLVTFIFWVLVFRASEQRGTLDFIYFCLAHGVTLLLMVAEALLGRVQFGPQNLRGQFIYVGGYGAIALLLLLKYDYPVYGFVDFRVSSLNRAIVLAIPLVVISFNYMAIGIGRLRNSVVRRVLSSRRSGDELAICCATFY